MNKEKTCPGCGEEFIVKPGEYSRKYCTKKCYFSKSENNPFFGKKHTKKAKLEIGRKNLGKKRSYKFKKQRSIDYEGKNNPFFNRKHNKSTKKHMSDTWHDGHDNSHWVGRKHTIISKEKMSRARSALVASGKLNMINISIKGFYNEMRFDSAYELARIKQLEKDKSIKCFKRNSIIIPYIYKKENKRYTPDFIITYKDDSVCVEEIKGYEKEVDIVKYKAARKFLKAKNMLFKVLYKNQIFENEKAYRSFLNDIKK
tara:strand:+ start:433 stop:1203 length:771 start_codon:yes stop_codon:yes gene_type:complete